MANPVTPTIAVWRKYVAAYLFAIVISVLTLFVRVALAPWIGGPPILILFILPIIFSAYVGGFWTGLLSTAVCAGGVYFLIFAKDQNILFFEGSVDLWQWVLLVMNGALISLVVEALHRSRKQIETTSGLLSVTLASIGDAVITTDGSGCVTFLNAEAERLTEWKNADAQGLPLGQVFRVISEITRQPVGDPATEVLQTGANVSLANHTVLLGRNGRETAIDDSGAPIREKNGSIAGVVLVFRDCTEEKRAEDALRESQALYHSLVEEMPAGVFRKDAAGHYVFVNPFFCRLRGVEPDQFLGRLPAELPESEAAFKIEAAEHHNHIMRTGQRVEVLDEYHRADGRTLYFQVVKTPVFDGKGNIIGSQGILFDATQRKKEEEQLAQSVSLLSTTIEASHDGLLVVDRNGHVTVFNTRFLELWKIPRELAEQGDDQLILKLASEQVVDPGEFLRRINELYVEPERVSYETLFFKDGRVIERVSQPQRLGDKIIGRVWSFRDMTERRLAEKAVADRERLLRQVIDLVPHFIFAKDRQSRFLFVNRACAQANGFAVDEMTGRSDLDLAADKAQAEAFLRDDREVIDTGKPKFIPEEKFVGKDGSLHLLETIKMPFAMPGLNEPAVLGVAVDITQRKQLENELRSIGERMTFYMNRMPLGFIAWDQQFRVAEWNAAAETIFGWTSAEALGRHAFDLIVPAEIQSRIQQIWEIILTTGTISSHSINENLTRDGRRIICEWRNTPWRDANSEICGCLSLVSDVTEKKAAEEKFALEQARFKLIFDSVPVGIAFHTTFPDGRCSRTINQAHLRICGLTRSQHDEPGIYDRITHPDDRDLRRPFDREVEAGLRNQYSLEKRYILPDGKIVWVNFSYQREVYPDGTRDEITTVVDITERKIAEQQSRQLAVIVESSEEAIISNMLDGTITSWNRGAETVFGYTAPEIVGASVLQLYPPELQNEQAGALAQISQGQAIEHFQTERIRKDGKRIRVSATISPLKDARGQVVGAATIARDITRQQMLEEQLRQVQKMEAIGQLAGGVAHDFNNILAVIQMQTELAKMDCQFTAEQDAYLNEVQTAAKRGANLTRQLLLFSRRQRLQPRELDLSDSIAGMTKMLRRILGEDIQIQFKYGPQPLLVQADAGMIDQLLMNLTLNSRDAMPNGGRLFIETAFVEMDELAVLQSPQARPGSFVRLTVTDTGSGIPPEILPRIFEPFFTTKDVGKGTGLGLATVFSIVQQHQGWINVDSQVDRGTTFDVYLPRLLKDATASAEPAAEPVNIPGGGETILLVEDDDAVRDSVHKCLSQLGYRLLEAATGASALKTWQQHAGKIHLLLSDLVMPGGMTGKELGERLLQDEPNLKVIFVSGYSAEAFTKNLSHSLGVTILSKPFSVQTLAQTVRSCLDKK